MLDLLLRGRDYGMGEALAELHRHERDNLHRFAGAGGLLDEDVSLGSAHVGDQAGLVGTKCSAGRGVQGCSSGQVELEYYTPDPAATEGPWCANDRGESGR